MCILQYAKFTIRFLCLSLQTLDSIYNLGLQKDKLKINILRNLCLQLFSLTEVCFIMQTETSFIMKSVEAKEQFTFLCFLIPYHWQFIRRQYLFIMASFYICVLFNVYLSLPIVEDLWVKQGSQTLIV